MDFLEWVIWLVFLKLYLVGIFLSESFWNVLKVTMNQLANSLKDT